MFSLSKAQAVVGSALAVGVLSMTAAIGSAAISFPAQIVVDGSTTVYPITNAASGPWASQIGDTSVNFPNGAAQPGSGAGKTHLLLGTIDIADSSATISPCTGGSAGAYTGGDCTNSSYPGGAVASTPYSTSQMDDWYVAHDGIIPVVNSSTLGSTISNLTKDQIANIYMCTVTDWNQINPAIPSGTKIVPVARSLESGTRASFLDMLKNSGSPHLTDAGEQACITSNGIRVLGNPDVQVAVASNANSVGYVGHGFLPYSGIQGTQVNGIDPTDANVLNSTYPLSRFLHMITLQYAVNPRPDTLPRSIQFINYILGAAGQDPSTGLVQQQGFIPLTAMQHIPEADVNMDGTMNVGDVVAIGQKWLQSNPGHPGWVRQDVNLDGAVNVSDVVTVGLQWLHTWSKWQQ